MEATLLEDAVGGLLKVVTNALKKAFACKESCERLKNKLEGMIPLLKEVLQAGEELSEDRLKPLREFNQELLKGEELVQKCSKVNRLNLWESYKYALKIEVLNLHIDEFTKTQGWALTYSELHLVRVNLEAKLENIGFNLKAELENVEHKIENIGVNLEARIERIIGDLSERFIRGIQGQRDLLENGQNASPLSIPELPDFTVGLEKSVRDLKERILCPNVSLIGVVGMGGSGKTTLAKALCNDIEVEDHFTYESEKRILFEKVSLNPNIMEILVSMWRQMVPGTKPNFRDVDDARRQLQEKLCPKEPKPTLVVLDDVWGKHHLEQLMFEGEGCKTLITSRNNDIVTSDNRYEKRLLEMSDAVPLFCHWAFGQRSIPEAADKKFKKLVREIISKCDGLPLALKVIGRSLYERPSQAWVTARDKLSQGQTLSDYHENALKCMATSVDILQEEVQECFLDMGIFPWARKISAELLLDLGIYVHGLQRPEEVYTILIELASRNLVKLVNNQKDTLWNFSENSCESTCIQHDILRELAIYLTKQEPVNKRKRIIMPQTSESFEDMWRRHAKSPFNAEIVSFTTGSMQEKDWCKMDFPNAKALILNFSASEYFLPPFMQSMNKLKVLVIVNNSSKRATLKGEAVLASLTGLKVVRLERIIVPPGLQKYWQSWQKLEKSSLILCEGFENMSPLPIGMGLDSNFSRLIEFTIDHCVNLKELPASIWQMTSLKRLSVTNCHDLQKLSDDIVKLSSLQMLRLNSSPSLTELPNSICNLRKLQFLDISLCQRIKQLPDKLGQLSSLERIDMRECSRLNTGQLPTSASELRSLERVICDEKIRRQWLELSIRGLEVEAAEEKFSLDWLQN